MANIRALINNIRYLIGFAFSSIKSGSYNIKGHISPFVHLYPINKIKIGQGTILREFTFIKGVVDIGESCIISHFSIIDAGENSYIKIGNNCTIGGGTKMYCEPNHYIPGPPNISHLKGNIVIGNNVMIGANVVILPSVTIGNNCAIGANAVVNNSLPSNSVAVGVPAKIIKKLT